MSNLQTGPIDSFFLSSKLFDCDCVLLSVIVLFQVDLRWDDCCYCLQKTKIFVCKTVSIFIFILLKDRFLVIGLYC